MKIRYWGIIAVLMFIHFHAMLKIAPVNLSIYLTSVIVLLITVFLYRYIFLFITCLSKGWHAVFFFLQALLMIIYLCAPPSLVYVIPVLVFIGLEILRHSVGRKFYFLVHKLSEFEKQSAQLNETFRIVRSERHDFLKHVSAIQFMIENENFQEGKRYLEKIVGRYEETNLSIKGEQGIVAGTLHSFFQRGKAKGVEVVYDLDLPISTLPLQDNDIVALLGNLLSNSIEACIEWQEETNKQALLTLEFYKKSGLYLLICKNSSLPIPNYILDNMFESYGKTTKSKNHEGLGTKIINDIVTRHQGLLDYTYKQQEFTVKIKFPAIQ